MIINNIKIPITKSQDELFYIALKKARMNKKNVKHYKILKKSIDAREKSNICYCYSVEIDEKEVISESVPIKKVKNLANVLVVGSGPAGLFCALYLARAGLKPTLIERGKSVEERKLSVNKFFKNGELDINSNIQFGEGGAGTFSDGKLNTGVSSSYIKAVLKDFVYFGAPSDIEYLNKPHIGSDNLPRVVKNIREEIIALGGKVLFNTKLSDIKISNGKIESVTLNDNLKFDDVVLAIGHSSRDTFEMLKNRGVKMEQKPFSVGFRIEHIQDEIGKAQYGEYYKILPSADYRLSTHLSQRGVFTFCMCPGGYVMPSSSEENMVVTNGMSNYMRDGKNSNSAILCEISGKDFKSSDVLAGVEYQRQLERKAFLLGGGEYKAPIQLVGDYLKNVKSSSLGEVTPTYSRGVNFANLNELFSDDINQSIKVAINDFDKKLKGFGKADSVLTGVETRSSSPIRITRDENYKSVNVENLYPCGEGCGYAGGIMSASVDGIRVALKIIDKYS